MYYYGSINSGKIRRINASKIDRYDVLKQVDIDEKLLIEKDNWYKIDGKTQFFKKRYDNRLFGEKLSEDINNALGIPTAHYDIVYLNGVLGLLSANFQDKSKYSYYDLYNIYKLLPIFKKSNGYITLKEILTFISLQDINGKEKLIQELIDRYVLEWVTNQTDANPHNIMFQYDQSSNSLCLTPSYDRERCFNGNEENSQTRDDYIWIPSIPYEEQSFRKDPYLFTDGIDANIVALYFDYPTETTKALERVFGADYESIFKKYSKNTDQMTLSPETISYLCGIIDKKSKDKEKIIAL